MGDDPPYGTESGGGLSQGVPPSDGKKTVAYTWWHMAVPPLWESNVRVWAVGGVVIYHMEEEYGHSVYCNRANYGPLWIGGAKVGDTGI